MRIGRRTRARPVIEHRIDQNLRAQRHFAAIARGDRQQRRMPATCAFTHHRDPVPIHAQILGMIVQPAQAGVIVFDRSLPARFGRKPIIDRHDHAAQFRRKPLQGRQHGLRVADNEPATMRMQDRRRLSRRIGVDHIHRHSGRAIAARNLLARPCRAGERGCAERGHLLAHRRQIGQGRGRLVRHHLHHLLRERPQLGIDEAQVDSFRITCVGLAKPAARQRGRQRKRGARSDEGSARYEHACRLLFRGAFVGLPR